jgi:hypothetical protein
MTIAQEPKITSFPFEIKDSKGNLLYWENFNGDWEKREYDSNNNLIYRVDSNGDWGKPHMNSEGNQCAIDSHIDSDDGYWDTLKWLVLIYVNPYLALWL